MKSSYYLLSIVLVVHFFCYGAKNKIPLNPIVSGELSQLFDFTQQLHSTLFEKKELQVKGQIQQLSVRLQKVMTIAKVEEQKGPHLNRILLAIDKELNLAQGVSGEDRIRFLQNAYRQFVMLYQSYEVDKKLNVFFCKSDRSVWLQGDSKPKNPFQPDSNCGRKVQ